MESNTSPLYVALANTSVEYWNARDTNSEVSVLDVSKIITERIPFSASFVARISAAFCVFP